MLIDDPVLPAAGYLTGPHAGDVLRPAVERAGGHLFAHRCTHVQYRAGIDLVAQFRVDVSWQAAASVSDTLVAACTATGAPRGTVPIVAHHHGRELEVGVWRWPFDPALPALDEAVRSSAARRMLFAGGVELTSTATVSVVVYRPMERAVIKVSDGDDVYYVKIVRPDRAAALQRRHDVLRAAGLPVPEVLGADTGSGWLALAELVGTTFRERIKSDIRPWIDVGEVVELVTRIASVPRDGLPEVRTRLLDAPVHAAVLASVLPDLAPNLAHLSEVTRRALDQRDVRGVVHGDLHEGQLVVADDGSITGLLDVDGLGLGDPYDDIAVPVGHLRHRALVADRDRARIDHLADQLRDAFVERRSDIEAQALDATTAAVLVGLATVPFRFQRPGWRDGVRTIVELAERAANGVS